MSNGLFVQREAESKRECDNNFSSVFSLTSFQIAPLKTDTYHVDVRVVEEQLHHVRVTVSGGEVERRGPGVRRDVRGALPLVQQHGDRLQVPVPTREKRRREAT